MVFINKSYLITIITPTSKKTDILYQYQYGTQTNLWYRQQHQLAFNIRSWNFGRLHVG